MIKFQSFMLGRVFLTLKSALEGLPYGDDASFELEELTHLEGVSHKIIITLRRLKGRYKISKVTLVLNVNKRWLLKRRS